MGVCNRTATNFSAPVARPDMRPHVGESDIRTISGDGQAVREIANGGVTTHRMTIAQAGSVLTAALGHFLRTRLDLNGTGNDGRPAG